jgi:hypothetical protein
MIFKFMNANGLTEEHRVDERNGVIVVAAYKLRVNNHTYVDCLMSDGDFNIVHADTAPIIIRGDIQDFDWVKIPALHDNETVIDMTQEEQEYAPDLSINPRVAEIRIPEGMSVPTGVFTNPQSEPSTYVAFDDPWTQSGSIQHNNDGTYTVYATPIDW